ncbi:PGPGW domain-containing protein [Mesorhizobium sp. LHD-90]|uniref:PGPGW domain-containing protein n=1 Tax=Mesorhizobium sp. LHD-90 TaxID=3071414 RepID=UPI0027E02D59|nr:PGPGW domain-containing protein [Mesorhizobium sp. LHD-90]MDQ6437914.1 PGPGW domain-containing protein [Mesorhizobium sp. LHD-90]
MNRSTGPDETGTPEPDGNEAGARRIKLLGREFRMPQSRLTRILIGVLLVCFGFLGFLPVLGFWMIPLGLLVLSYEFSSVRRLRRRFVVWWERRRRP